MAVGKNEMVLELGKHFLIIDSNKSFFLEDNQGFRAYRPSGAWQIDCWKLLPEQWHKIYPVYTLKIEWENSEDDKDYIPAINATDLDLGDGIAGVSGQPVNITAPVTVANLPNLIVGEQNTVPASIVPNSQPLEVVNHATNVIDGFINYFSLNLSGKDLNDFAKNNFEHHEMMYVKFLGIYGNGGGLTIEPSIWKDVFLVWYTANSVFFRVIDFNGHDWKNIDIPNRQDFGMNFMLSAKKCDYVDITGR